MKRLRKMNLNGMIKTPKLTYILLVFTCVLTVQAQEQRVKIDGVAAVVGDYVILESDIEKTLIDLKSQGVNSSDFTRCQILGKLMEDRLYAHQAVQDSILVSDEEVRSVGERQLQQLLAQTGSMDRILKIYKKESEESFKEDLFKINKLRMLSEKMQNKIIIDVEVTPEEVRQFFNNLKPEERPVFGAELEIAQIVKTPIAPDEEKQKVINRLKQIKADVEDNGASFSVKAILYSQDPGSKPNGGKYTMTRETQFVKEFKDVAFSLQEGEISEPFETDFGYHIIYIEKIRGQEIDLRHILLIPEIPQKSVDAAVKELNEIRDNIIAGKFTFAEAALNFSDEKETKFDGGLLRNPTNFDSRFELTKMDPTLNSQVRNLKDNEISKPIAEPDPRGGATKYKILQVTNRYEEHPAEFAKDYLKIQELAKTEKQLKEINKWRAKNIESTYISVNGDYDACVFVNNWLKE